MCYQQQNGYMGIGVPRTNPRDGVAKAHKGEGGEMELNAVHRHQEGGRCGTVTRLFGGGTQINIFLSRLRVTVPWMCAPSQTWKARNTLTKKIDHQTAKITDIGS